MFLKPCSVSECPNLATGSLALGTPWPVRFLSDSNVVGGEKINATQIPDAFLETEWEKLPPILGGQALSVAFFFFQRLCVNGCCPDGHLLAPFSVGYVKGWKRSVSLLVVLAAVRKLDLGEQIPHNVKAVFFFVFA